MPIKRSKYEDKIFKNAKRDKASVEYESTIFEYTVDYTNKIDVELTTKSGNTIYLELKGGNSWRYFNSDYRKKWLAMYNLHKDESDIRLLFEKDFKIGKVLTVSGWCERNNIKHAIGDRIPKEWLNE